MHLLMVSQYWTPDNGVPQRRWAWLSHILNEQGYTLDVVTPGGRSILSVKSFYNELFQPRDLINEHGPNGERIFRTRGFRTSSSLTARVANQAFVAADSLVLACAVIRRAEQKPDILIATVPALPSAFVVFALSRFFKLPYVIDLRDAWPELLAFSNSWNDAVGSRSIRERVLRLGPLQLMSFVTSRLVNRTLVKADGVIFTSEMHRQYFLKKYAGIQRVPRTAVIRNVFPPRTTYIKKYSNKDALRPLRVLYAGTMGRAQDLENILHAARIAHDSGFPIQLRFVGAGAAKPQLKKLGEELKVDIEFYDQAPADQLRMHYEWSDTAMVHLMGWLPLRLAIPSKTYELISSGIHVTAVGEGALPALIRFLGAGDVVAPGDPLELAKSWKKFAERGKFRQPDQAREWIQSERQHTARQALFEILRAVRGGKQND